MGAEQKITAAKPLVYERIAAVQGELAHTGIGKDSENTFDRYKFRGIDAVYNALGPLLAKHGLCVLPRIIERESVERVSKKGDPMFYVTVTAEFDFVAAEDGSIHTVRTYGEAMDRSDKATNKAMSAAYKYAAFMAFAIPTEGDNDADASTHEIEGRQGPAPITDEQWAKIVQLCQATKTQGDEVKSHIKADNLKLLTDKQFSEAIDYLENKLAKTAREETDAMAKEPA